MRMVSLSVCFGAAGHFRPEPGCRAAGRAGLTRVWLAGCRGNDRVIKGLVGLRSLGIAGMMSGDRPTDRAGCRLCPGCAGGDNVEGHDRGTAQGCPLAGDRGDRHAENVG
jgi:hypothetical protein